MYPHLSDVGYIETAILIYLVGMLFYCPFVSGILKRTESANKSIQQFATNCTTRFLRIISNIRLIDDSDCICSSISDEYCRNSKAFPEIAEITTLFAFSIFHRILSSSHILRTSLDHAFGHTTSISWIGNNCNNCYGRISFPIFAESYIRLIFCGIVTALCPLSIKNDTTPSKSGAVS